MTRRPFLPLRLLRRRGALLLAAFLAADAAVAVAACSSSSPDADAPDATNTETSVPEGGGGDSPITPAEAGKDGGGHCTPVKGPCDIVLQDCPDDKGKKQECVVSGTTATECVPVQGSQQLPT